MKRFLEPEMRDGFFVDEKTKKVFKVLIDLLEEFKRICEKYKLQYFADSGTLIGAVRHKGFVPWDDDVDIRMPRQDFERFIDIAKKELPPYYFCQTPLSDPDFEYDIIRLRDSRTTATEQWRIDCKLHLNMGIWIGILPLDGCPKDHHVAESILFRKRIINELLRYSMRKHCGSFRRMAMHIIAKFIVLLVGRRRLIQRRRNLFAACPLDECEHVTGLHSLHAYYVLTHVKLRAEDFRETLEVPFEYTTIRIPKGYDRILTAMYGDWRKPVKGTQEHEVLDCDPDVPYEEYVEKKYGYRP